MEEPELDIVLEAEENDLDGLNYLAGKTMNLRNQNAMKGTILAHVDGGVPNLRFDIPRWMHTILRSCSTHLSLRAV